MHSNAVAMNQCLDDMINHIWKLRSRAIPYIGIQVKIDQGILSKCPNGQGNGFCPSQMVTIAISRIDKIHKSLILYYNSTKYEE